MALAKRPDGRAEKDSDARENQKLLWRKREVELKKVTWPNKSELKDATRVVVVASILLTIFVGIVDQILTQVIKLVFR